MLHDELEESEIKKLFVQQNARHSSNGSSRNVSVSDTVFPCVPYLRNPRDLVVPRVCTMIIIFGKI